MHSSEIENMHTISALPANNPKQLPTVTSRVERYFQEIVAQELILKHPVTSIMQLPGAERIVVHTTSKRYVNDRREILPALAALELITGQKARYTYAKRSVATYKVRQGQLVGCQVSLRGEKMYRFLESFLTIVLPRIRDFAGIDYTRITSHGRVAMGISNPLVFPELQQNYQLFEQVRGMDIEFAVSTFDKTLAASLYAALSLPRQVN